MARTTSGGRPAEHPLRVALDTTYAGTNPTGVGLYSRRLVFALRDIAREQRLSLRCIGPACSSADAPHGGPLAIAQEWPVYTHGVLPVRLSSFRPHVVHATSHIGPLWGPGRLVVTVHDLIFLRRPQYYSRAWLAVTRALLPRVLRRASAIVCDSEATREDLARALGVPPGKSLVIYPGIDGSFRDAGSGPPPMPFAYVLCLGPWVLRKNFEVVLKAFPDVAQQHRDLRLVVTGGPSPGVQGYTTQMLAQQLPDELRHRLVLPGFVSRDELARWVTGASVLAYPSVDEGFGLPPLEAMAAGVPVVVADTPAVVEATGGAAVVAPANDPSAWAERLNSVLTQDDLAEKMRAAGKQQSARFTWEACALEFARLYRRLQPVPDRNPPA